MTSPTMAPPHLRTNRGLPTCTERPTDGGLLQMFLWPFQTSIEHTRPAWESSN